MGNIVGQIDLGLDINRKSFTKQLFGISKSAEKDVGNAFSGLGKKIGVALGTGAVIAFAKSCINLGSDLTEVQNVVDTTFTTMSDKVNAFAKTTIDQFGLSETVTKNYMGVLGTMSKSMGFSESQAYDMAKAVTSLSGNVASFYNMTSDEAYNKLKSIWTGETETLKSLGVMLTQTNLDQYALNNGFDKTTSQMTEQEKVMLRYQYTLSALGAAQGDFAKTSDLWANQVRVLSLRFDSLKATLGQGFINLFTPIIRSVNTLLASLDVLAQKFVAITQLLTGKQSIASTGSQINSVVSDMADSTDSLTSGVSDLGSTAKKAAKEATAGLAGFDKLNNLTDSDSDSGSSGSGASTGTDIGSLTPASGTMLEDVTVNPEIEKAINKIKDACQPTLDALKKLKDEGLAKLGDFTFTALKDFYDEFLVPVGKWVMGKGLPDLIDAFNNFLNKIDFSSINKSLKKFWKALEPFAEAIGEGLVQFFSDLLSIGADFINVVLPNGLNALSNVLNGMDPATIKALAYALAATATSLTAIKVIGSIAIVKDLAALCALDFSSFATFGTSLATAMTTFHGWEPFAADFIDGLEQAIRDLLPESARNIYDQFMTSLGGAVVGAAAGAWAGPAGMIIGGLMGALLTVKIDGKAIGNHLLDGIKDGFKTVFNWDATKAIFDDFMKRCNDIATGEGGILGVAKNIVLGLGEGLVAAAGLIVEPIGDFCVGIIDCVKELFGIHSPSTVFAEIGGFLGQGLINGVKGMFESVKQVFVDMYSKIKGVFTNVGTWFSTKFGSAWSGIKSAFDLKSIGTFFSGVWSNIKGSFGNVTEWFRTKFTNAWTAVKNVFSKGGKIFDGIKDGILSGLKTVINALIGGINKVIATPFNGLNKALQKIHDVDILGVKPFSSIGQIGVPQIPKLAQGGYVQANTPQLAMIGDNRHQGEVVAPEDKLQELLDKATSKSTLTQLQMAELLAILRDILRLLGFINDKDNGVYIGDTELGKAVQRFAKSYKQSTGKEAF